MANRWDTGLDAGVQRRRVRDRDHAVRPDIGIPESEFDDLWSAIFHEWPSYLGYATSFLTIGALWLGHHAVFRRLRYANNRVMQVNLLLLMAVSFLPFPTRLVAEAIRDESAERAAAIFYGSSLLAIVVLFSALWATVARDRELLRPEVTDEEVNALLVATSPSIGFYAGAIALAIVAPQIARCRLPADRRRRDPESAR